MDRITFLRWSLVGLLLRFLIMPFTLHTMDLFYIYYFPYQLVSQGTLDIYRWIEENFPQFRMTYYPPLTYFIMAGFLFFLRGLLPDLGRLLGDFSAWFSTHGGGTVHYATFVGGEQIFRTLLVLKIPYLFFDFATGFLLVRLAKDRQGALLCYQLWMLNPIVLYSVYAIGQFDGVPIFLTVLALYWADRQKIYLSLIALSLGGLAKVYPFLLVPLFILFLGKTLKERLKLAVVSLLVLVFILVPLFVSSKGAVMESIFISSLENVTGGVFRKFLLGVGYLCFLFWAPRAKNHNSLALLVLLLYALVGLAKFRYLSWLSPFLILAIVRDRTLGWLSLVLVFLMAEVHLAGNQVQWGLLDPLYPTFFASLPILDSFLLAFSFPLEWIHRASYLLFLLVGSIIFYRVWKCQGSY